MKASWKRPLGAMVLATALIFGLAGTTGVNHANVAEAASESMRDVVSVVGTGSLNVEPDIAYINLGVMSNAATASKAQEQNAALFNKVYKVLTETYGVNAKDINTTDFSVQPQYQYKDNQEPKIVSYNAYHMVKVNYRDVKKVGALVDAASKAGANQINNISFDVEDKSDAETAALEKAVAHAKKKAEALAKAGGRTLGTVITMTELSSDYNPVRVDYSQMAKMESTMDQSANSAPQGGQVKLDIRVQVDFTLK